jgi:large subunit ribosomal protein L29
LPGEAGPHPVRAGRRSRPDRQDAFERAAEKLPIKTKVVARLGESLLEDADMAQIEELKSRTDDQLVEQLAELKREQFNLRFQAATNQIEKPSRVREVRRTIARIKTLQTERARAAQVKA